ncbi:MAG: hypothetical protein WBA46_14415 [Thermomicrobiales bacterium]
MSVHREELPPEPPINPDLELVRDRRFRGETVRLDGKDFRHCHFYGCILVFGATKPFHLYGDIRFDNNQWSFVEKARETINVLKLLRELGGGMTEMVDQVLDSIRGVGLESKNPDVSA